MGGAKVQLNPKGFGGVKNPPPPTADDAHFPALSDPLKLNGLSRTASRLGDFMLFLGGLFPSVFPLSKYYW